MMALFVWGGVLSLTSTTPLPLGVSSRRNVSLSVWLSTFAIVLMGYVNFILCSSFQLRHVSKSLPEDRVLTVQYKQRLTCKPRRFI